MKDLKTLIVTIEGGGNIPPIFGFAKSLKKKGHSITVLSEPCMKPAVHEFGASFVAFKKHFLRENRNEDLFQDWNASKFNNPIFERVMFGPAKSVVEQTIEVIESNSIDLLVLDILLFPAVIAAKYCNLPVVILHHMPEYLPGNNRPPGNMGLKPGNGFLIQLRDKILGNLFNLKFNEYKSGLNEILSSLSLKPVNNTVDLIEMADLRLIQTLRSFDIPILPPPKNVRYTGPVLDDPDWAAEKQWKNPWQDKIKKPLVVVSFSSTFQNQNDAIQNSINALSELPVNGIVTLGPAMEETILNCPENVKVLKSVAHSILFPQSDLVITHGGHGTIMRALANGLPILCLPMGRDQNDNAIKIEQHGLGIQLSPKSSALKIRKAVKQILSDNKFNKNVECMKIEIKANKGLDEVITEIEKLLPLAVE